MFTIYFDGEAETLINELGEKAVAGELNRDEKDLYRKIHKALQYLETNPRHPGLKSHEIDVLTEKYGVRIWESYLENRKAGARRMFWIYGRKTKRLPSSALRIIRNQGAVLLASGSQPRQ